MFIFEFINTNDLERLSDSEVYNDEQMLEAWALDPLQQMIAEEDEFESYSM